MQAVGANIAVLATSGEFVGKSPYQLASESVKKVVHVFLFEQIAVGNSTSVGRLLSGGAPFDQRDGFALNDTTLHWAVSFGNIDVAKLLVAHGCNVNLCNNNGQSSLHFACKNNNLPIVEMLLQAGADPNLRDKEGRIPLDMCPAAASEDLLAVLRSPPKVVDLVNQIEIDNGHLLTDIHSSTVASSAAVDLLATTNDHSTSSPVPGALLDQEYRDVPTSDRDTNSDPMLVFWPPVQRQESSYGGSLVLTSANPVVLVVVGADVDTIEMLTITGLLDVLDSFGLQSQVKRSARNALFRLSVDPLLCPGHNRYEINITAKMASIIASDSRGLLYAVTTLTQLIQLHATVNVDESSEGQAISVILPGVKLQDWPDFEQRAVQMTYRENAQLSMTVFSNYIQVFSKLRLNALVLVVDTIHPDTTTHELPYPDVFEEVGQSDESEDGDDDDESQDDDDDILQDDNTVAVRTNKEIQASSYNRGIICGEGSFEANEREVIFEIQ